VIKYTRALGKLESEVNLKNLRLVVASRTKTLCMEC